MSVFTLDGFVAAARRAAATADPVAAADALMARTFARPADIAAAVPDFADDEVTLYEDDTVSIWHERFLPTEVLPPHDHALPALIGVYAGRERNVLYRPGPDGLVPSGTLELGPGDTHVFGADAVHTVQALDGRPSLGLHVYLGPLTRVPRRLYDWEDLSPRPMTGANFDALKRSA